LAILTLETTLLHLQWHAQDNLRACSSRY
jgi:hypothetical protein